jgi:uncharacterized membrane-anchored protein
MNWSLLAALAPLVLVGLAFVVWCLIDLQQREPRYLPRWAWMVIVLISIPAGGIIYLLVGRGAEHPGVPQ